MFRPMRTTCASVLNYNYDYVNPFAGNFNRTPQKWHWPNQVGVLHYTWTINPTMINEFTASASADHITISYDESNGLFNRDLYGIDFPYIYPASRSWFRIRFQPLTWQELRHPRRRPVSIALRRPDYGCFRQSDESTRQPYVEVRLPVAVVGREQL